MNKQEENIEKQLLRKDISEEKKEKLRRLAVQDGFDTDEVRGADDGEGIGQYK